mmetsp:Transcript_5175/g.7254  ORF Transcript_5175/g.7254 Transcript_5175/m.7254 type:complete len:359 (-) Transcript_5175:509-1585(-)
MTAWLLLLSSMDMTTKFTTINGNNGFARLSSFTATGLGAVTTMTFIVQNDGGPSGLLVQLGHVIGCPSFYPTIIPSPKPTSAVPTIYPTGQPTSSIPTVVGLPPHRITISSATLLLANHSYGTLLVVLVVDSTPSTMTSIPDNALNGCASLISHTCHQNWFAVCTSLTSVIIPTSVTTIGSGAFQYCTSLISVTIPTSLRTLSDWIFGNCNSLTAVTIPTSVTTTGCCIFMYSSCLNSVIIPTSVSSMGDNFFYQCSSLTSASIPTSVTNFGVQIFLESAVTSVNIPTSVPALLGGVFFISSLVIPTSIRSLGGYAFQCCSSLTSIVIATSVLSVGRRLFKLLLADLGHHPHFSAIYQ